MRTDACLRFLALLFLFFSVPAVQVVGGTGYGVRRLPGAKSGHLVEPPSKGTK